MKTTTNTKPSDLNPIARALVPFFVAYIASHRAVHSAHVNAVRAAGGQIAHIRATSPRFERARAALIHAFAMHDADMSDKRAARAVAVELCKAEQATRESGKTWDSDAAVSAWRAAA